MIKSYLPRSLYGRAALIMVMPVVVLQLAISVAFIQRHFERVTQQLTGAVVLDANFILGEIARAPTLAKAQSEARYLAQKLRVSVKLPETGANIPAVDLRSSLDLSGGAVIRTLRENLPELIAVDLLSQPKSAQLFVRSEKGVLRLEVSRDRFSAANPHQLLVLMVFTAILMTLIANVFLRNQLKPITNLSAAAEAFGRGEARPYNPRGALEVRAAGHAFLAMRARIERHIETRTLMLSGISHDLRSPLTRLRLGIALLPPSAESAALEADISDMERLVDEFLAFARGDALDDVVAADPVALLLDVVAKAVRGGQIVKVLDLPSVPPLSMRPAAIARALENLLGNAARYAQRCEVSLLVSPEMLRFVVEDDGPGISEADYTRAIEPFQRLDAARNPNHGGGVGLGLSIATDIARSHGGGLNLGQSARLGGLRAELRIAR